MSTNASRIRIRIRQFLVAALLPLAGCGTSGAPSAVGSLELTATDLGPMVPARVVRVLVEEGQAVRAGDTLAILTQAGLRDQVSEARARVLSAEATVEEL